MSRPPRLGTVAILAIGIAIAACVPGKRSDPGDLEIRNFLLDPVLAVVGGRIHDVPACSTIALADVELRGVRIVTSGGLDLMKVDSPRGVPIGPRRFILVLAPTVQDLRTRPNGDPPNRIANCQGRLQDMVRPGGRLGG